MRRLLSLLLLLGLVQLTRPDGEPIWLAPAQIVSITSAIPQEHDRGVRTRVLTLSGPVWVREEPSDVVRRLQTAQ